MRLFTFSAAGDAQGRPHSVPLREPMTTREGDHQSPRLDRRLAHFLALRHRYCAAQSGEFTARQGASSKIADPPEQAGDGLRRRGRAGGVGAPPGAPRRRRRAGAPCGERHRGWSGARRHAGSRLTHSTGPHAGRPDRENAGRHAGQHGVGAKPSGRDRSSEAGDRDSLCGPPSQSAWIRIIDIMELRQPGLTWRGPTRANPWDR